MKIESLPKFQLKLTGNIDLPWIVVFGILRKYENMSLILTETIHFRSFKFTRLLERLVFKKQLQLFTVFEQVRYFLSEWCPDHSTFAFQIFYFELRLGWRRWHDMMVWRIRAILIECQYMRSLIFEKQTKFNPSHTIARLAKIYQEFIN